MLHINQTIRNKQLYNLLYSIYTAPNDYLCIYSLGCLTGWCCKASFLTPEMQSQELDRITTFAKVLEKARRKQIASQNIA